MGNTTRIAPVTDAELGEIGEYIEACGESESLKRFGFGIFTQLANDLRREREVNATARNQAGDLAAELKAIEGLVEEAGISRRNPTEPVRSLVARLIADANEEGDKLEAAEAELERYRTPVDIEAEVLTATSQHIEPRLKRLIGNAVRPHVEERARLARENKALRGVLRAPGISAFHRMVERNEALRQLADARAEIAQLTRQRDVALAAVDMAEALSGGEADEGVTFAPRTALNDCVLPLTIGAGDIPAGARPIEADGEVAGLLRALFNPTALAGCSWYLVGRGRRDVPGGRTSRGIDAATLLSHGMLPDGV